MLPSMLEEMENYEHIGKKTYYCGTILSAFKTVWYFLTWIAWFCRSKQKTGAKFNVFQGIGTNFTNGAFCQPLTFESRNHLFASHLFNLSANKFPKHTFLQAFMNIIFWKFEYMKTAVVSPKMIKQHKKRASCQNQHVLSSEKKEYNIFFIV